ncbi:MAG: MarC family protein [Actinomycetia bacterium]|nr:MarC family protein [Actinomycetes bacterium]
MTSTDVATFAAALFALANPLIRIGPFIEITGRFPAEIRRRFAYRASMVQVIGFLVSTWFGASLLDLLGVSIPALKAAGGGVILALAFPMVLGTAEKTEKRDQEEIDAMPDERTWKAAAVVPFGVPLLVGGGQMALLISTTAEFDSTKSALIVSACCLAVVAVMLASMLLADPLKRLMGASGIQVITRLFGFVLVAIGFSVLTGGLNELMPGLAG